jgi:hypothetical protein
MKKMINTLIVKKIINWILLGFVISEIFKNLIEFNYYGFGFNMCIFIYLIKELVKFNININLNINNNFNSDK